MERQESLMDAKRRVHALIDEAFSLVSLNANPRGNAVAPAPPSEESNSNSVNIISSDKKYLSCR